MPAVSFRRSTPSTPPTFLRGLCSAPPRIRSGLPRQTVSLRSAVNSRRARRDRPGYISLPVDGVGRVSHASTNELILGA
jgi:hypothetical protein